MFRSLLAVVTGQSTHALRQSYSSWSRNLASLSSACDSSSDAFGPVPSLPTRRVVVTGLGLVTPLGVGVLENWRSLLTGKTGIRQLMKEDLPQDHHVAYESLPSKVIGCVPKQQLVESKWYPSQDGSKLPPCTIQVLCAAAEAVEDSAVPLDSPDVLSLQRAGVAVGAGMANISEIAAAGQLVMSDRMRRMSPYFVPRILSNMPAGHISIRYGLKGPNHSSSTACATGVHSVGDAFRMIQRGDADVMIAGACESSIDAVSLGGFSRMKALSTRYNSTPELASRPFDVGRDGFVMGEGAGILILEELEFALQRRAPQLYAEIRGYGLSGDGHHITAPPLSGAGPAAAMTAALGSDPQHRELLAYINAHATSTPQGDEAEQRAIMTALGEELAHRVAVSSTKGATGHLLGAAGAVETIFTILALHTRQAPPTVNLEQPTPALLPRLIASSSLLLAGGPMTALCNSFGFGGTNTSLLVSTPPVVKA